jgi:ribonuclease G
MKKILVNISPWESRVAVLRGKKLVGVHFESKYNQVLERSFIKGKILKVFPGIQTAFVEIGQERAGFLHISEIDRDLALNKIDGVDQLSIIADQSDLGETPKKRASDVNMGSIFKEGESILVQVSKEPIGEKGAKLTTCFTVPGRFIVLLPNINRIAISKKIEKREDRQKLKEMITKHLPAGMGAIIRTSAAVAQEDEIYKDINFLLTDWKSVIKKYDTAKDAEVLYKDLDVSLQVVRDHLDRDVEEILTDSAENQEHIIKYLKSVAPEYCYRVKLYGDQLNLFEAYNVEKQIKAALHKKVMLKSGGSIVIDVTEAMTVIDVNTGKFIGKNNQHETILKTNLEASREVACQLRLRNIGGLIVIDFIDMENMKDREELVRNFEKLLKEYDKFQSVVLGVSEFGLVQMTRKRSGKRLTQKFMTKCMSCYGFGQVMSVCSESYALLRKLQGEVKAFAVTSKKILISVHPQVFDFLSSVEAISILTLEKENNCSLTVVSDPSMAMHTYKLKKNK